MLSLEPFWRGSFKEESRNLSFPSFSSVLGHTQNQADSWFCTQGPPALAASKTRAFTSSPAPPHPSHRGAKHLAPALGHHHRHTFLILAKAGGDGDPGHGDIHGHFRNYSGRNRSARVGERRRGQVREEPGGREEALNNFNWVWVQELKRCVRAL